MERGGGEEMSNQWNLTEEQVPAISLHHSNPTLFSHIVPRAAHVSVGDFLEFSSVVHGRRQVVGQR